MCVVSLPLLFPYSHEYSRTPEKCSCRPDLIYPFQAIIQARPFLTDATIAGVSKLHFLAFLVLAATLHHILLLHAFNVYYIPRPGSKNACARSRQREVSLFAVASITFLVYLISTRVACPYYHSRLCAPISERRNSIATSYETCFTSPRFLCRDTLFTRLCRLRFWLTPHA